MEYLHHYLSPLGGITLAGADDALTGLWFDGQKYFGQGLDRLHANGPLPVFQEAERWLDIYFSGSEPDFTPKLRMKTTPFRACVWEILTRIPYGQTVTYGSVAAQVARQLGLTQMSAQAVGGAVGHNAISLIIPCHRVIGADGRLTGYAGGIEKKEALLRLERSGSPCRPRFHRS